MSDTRTGIEVLKSLETPEIEFSSGMTVKLVRSMASDDMVVQAAQVSGKGENNPKTVPARLINALIAGKHGSPFEHNAFTFFVEAPIFVFREWHRHRIASINEMSGRYTELRPKFYIPGDERLVINSGTSMKPIFKTDDGGTDQEQALEEVVYYGKQVAKDAWDYYQTQLNMGIAKEVARMVLPVSIYSQMYWTVNARSLMNFLSLRSTQEGALFPGYPQREIQMAAEKIEFFFGEEMPLTYAAFVAAGRVAP